MHELYELKEKLMDELNEYSRRGDMSGKDLEMVEKLTTTVKNICKIIEAYEEEEGSYAMGGSYEGGSYNRGGSYDGGSYRGGSYARGGRGGRGGRTGANQYGSYARGYSRGEEMADQLRELMQDAPDKRTRMDIQKIVQRIESM